MTLFFVKSCLQSALVLSSLLGRHLVI